MTIRSLLGVFFSNHVQLRDAEMAAQIANVVGIDRPINADDSEFLRSRNDDHHTVICDPSLLRITSALSAERLLRTPTIRDHAGALNCERNVSISLS